MRRDRWRWALPAGILAIGSSAVVLLLWFWLARDPLFSRAQEAFDSGDYRASLRLTQEKLKVRPDDPRTNLLAARSLCRLGFFVQGESHYQRAGLLANSLDDLHNRAYAMVIGEQPDRAAEIYQQILSRSPADLLALKRLAAVQMAQKQWKSVIALADRLVAAPGGDVDGQTLAAYGHHELRQYGLAVDAARRVLEIDPSLGRMPLPPGLFWNSLALDLIALGRTSEAETYLVQALRDLRDPKLMELLGLACFHQGAVDRAEEYWSKSLEWDPENADALLGMGRLALNRNRPGEAVGWLERAVKASPQSLEPVYNLARAYRLLGRTAEAERFESRAAEIRAERPATGGMGDVPE